MKRAVIKSDLALLDLEQTSDYLAKRSPRAALRFVDAAENVFERLATMPGIGTLYQPRNPAYG